jgi:REP element-mobilizing transposase RayT
MSPTPSQRRSFFGPLNPTIETWAGYRVWVVGASSGIGAELARTLHRRGARVALSARRLDALREVMADAPAPPVDAEDPTLPQEFIETWKSERDDWLLKHPKPWNPETEAQYHSRFSDAYLEHLDSGLGSCVLKQTDCAEAVEQALCYFDGQRYTLKSFVIMPNHVHVLVRLHDGWPLERVIQNWKERSAKGINAALGSTGKVWQKGYFDRLIRSVEHWEFVDGYIRHNPEKAKLRSGFRIWSADESSAFWGKRER